jgi:triosephosphate isomerase
VASVHIFANWKMNLTRLQAEEFIGRMVADYGARKALQLAVCAPCPYLGFLSPLCEGSSIGIGAQNMHSEEAGAFTGEVSAGMLAEVGCSYVLLGHSERRRDFQESDGAVGSKALTAIRHGLTPIVCIGETREEREAGRTFEILRRQAAGCLAGVPPGGRLWLAYEPRWAIGTGITPSGEEIEAVHGFLRGWIEECCGSELSGGIPILYGGSVDSRNSAAICRLPHVDGLGYGGCSLDYRCFTAGIDQALEGAGTGGLATCR